MMGHREVTTGVLNGEGGAKRGVRTTLTRETYPLCPKFPRKRDINGTHSRSNKPRYLDGLGITALSRANST